MYVLIWNKNDQRENRHSRLTRTILENIRGNILMQEQVSHILLVMDTEMATVHKLWSKRVLSYYTFS